MKKIAALALLVVLAVSLIPSAALASGPARIYDGVADTYEELVFSVAPAGDKWQVFQGLSTGNSNDAILTLKGDRIYKGKTLTNANVLFTIENDRIIPGLDSRQSNALFTVRDGRVYAGRVTTPDNILYTFEVADRGRLYEGKSKQLSDVVFTVDGHMDEILFLLPILAEDLF